MRSSMVFIRREAKFGVVVPPYIEGPLTKFEANRFSHSRDTSGQSLVFFSSFFFFFFFFFFVFSHKHKNLNKNRLRTPINAKFATHVEGLEAIVGTNFGTNRSKIVGDISDDRSKIYSICCHAYRANRWRNPAGFSLRDSPFIGLVPFENRIWIG